MSEDFCYSDLDWNSFEDVKLSYPKPVVYATKLIVPDHVAFFPMETAIYSNFSFPTESVNLLRGFKLRDMRDHQRVGDFSLTFKIDQLYGLPEPSEAMYLGRSTIVDVFSLSFFSFFSSY